MSEVSRRLATILAADAVGFSRLMSADEEATLRTLNACLEVINAQVDQHGGRVFGRAGDSVLAEFSSPLDAVRCGIAIQAAIEERNAELPQERGMRFRIGINLGDVMVEGGNLFGDGVNIAVRLEGIAEAGGILVSGSVHDRIAEDIGVSFKDLGRRKLKNIAEPVGTYRLRVGAEGQRDDELATRLGSPAAERLRAKVGDWLKSDAEISAALTEVARLVRDKADRYVKNKEGEAPPAAKTRAAAGPAPDRKRATKAPVLSVPDQPSIAVLPFEVRAGGEEARTLADGLTDRVRTALARAPGLFVIARHSSYAYKGRDVSVRAIARELGVRHVLTGSVRTDGEDVRLSARLIDGATAGVEWQDKYDRRIGDAFAAAGTMAWEIWSALDVAPADPERLRHVPDHTPSLEAYGCYLRAREHAFRFTRDDSALALMLLEKARELDPTHAPAFAFLAMMHLQQAQHGWGATRGGSLELAEEYARRATGLDGTLPLAHVALANVHLWRRRHDEAVTEVERGLALDASNAGAYETRAAICNWTGRPDAAIEAIREAMRLDPHNSILFLFDLGHAYFVMQRYRDAISAFLRGTIRNPDFMPDHLFLAASHARLGEDDDARREMAESIRIAPDTSQATLGELLPYRDAHAMDHLMTALRRAGLPE
ncbi:MAG: adenylate/guanylate cyclase domain-containing protein [Alphaproteobacteria bacterium]